MKKKEIGTITLMNTVDVTDPCYDRDVWCRKDKVPVVSGYYTCYVWEKRVKEYGYGSYEVNAKIGIYKDGVIPDTEDMEEIGDIGVDSGLAGFFYDKPDYDDAAWKKLCDSIKSDSDGDIEAWINDDGFFSRTAYGDGDYLVLAHKDEYGRADALEIVFD